MSSLIIFFFCIILTRRSLDFGPDESGLRNFVPPYLVRHDYQTGSGLRSFAPLDLERNDYNHCLFCYLIALLCSRLVLPYPVFLSHCFAMACWGICVSFSVYKKNAFRVGTHFLYLMKNLLIFFCDRLRVREQYHRKSLPILLVLELLSYSTRNGHCQRQPSRIYRH